MLRWAVARTVKPRIDRTERGSFPVALPSFRTPRAAAELASVTWVGHATFLIQLAGLNVLVDPVWSNRCSPVQFAGPRRYMSPGVEFGSLPPVDMVLLSHDHYDHLDATTTRMLVAAYPDADWIVPLGLSEFLAHLGVAVAVELDWGDKWEKDGVTISGVPSQHFSGRGIRRNRSLWCGWTISGRGRRVYFVGDTGRHPLFREIGVRFGPFDAVLMPIGAYDPRWFMAPVHINPEEAVTAHLELTEGAGRFCPMVAMHWGTFKLTDEPMTEPPERAMTAWSRAGLDLEHLWIMRHGETRWLP